MAARLTDGARGVHFGEKGNGGRRKRNHPNLYAGVTFSVDKAVMNDVALCCGYIVTSDDIITTEHSLKQNRQPMPL